MRVCIVMVVRGVRTVRKEEGSEGWEVGRSQHGRKLLHFPQCQRKTLTHTPPYRTHAQEQAADKEDELGLRWRPQLRV